MSIIVYLKYKLHGFKNFWRFSSLVYGFREDFRDFRKVKTYVDLYATVFVFVVLADFVGFVVDELLIYGSFIGLIALWFVNDYLKGDHNRWNKERIRSGMEQKTELR